ncbi:MAG: hypothetical protein K5924_12685 [Chloroflexi bacterium]|nr:hypothetical protein [Chloroflexota bacterium]
MLTDLADLARLVYGVQTVQVLLLRREGVVDEAASDAILRAIDGVQLGHKPVAGSVSQLVATLDDRVNAAIPGEIAGASALGRTRFETISTVLRMHWRARTADIAELSLKLQTALLELANAHTVTVMGAFADRKAAAPTTLAHFLGGVIGALHTGWRRFPAAIDAVDRSPLGAGLMVGEVFSGDRTQAAELLGFTEPILNTLDAAGSVEDIVQMVETSAAQSATIRRFTTELLTWIRTDPTSFFIDERWESAPEPSHPAHSLSVRLEQLNQDAHRAELDARVAIDLLRAQPYGPIGANWDSLARPVDQVFGETGEVIITATAAVREALIINRAYLANRAGRLYSTASDLAAFLMEDQQLNPTAAQRIAGLAVARLKEATLEAAQITPDIIDAAAVMVIGQELKVEMETLGRYIAPRRYIERRDVLGSPKADRTREWLATVEASITANAELIAERKSRWNKAMADIDRALAESASSDES